MNNIKVSLLLGGLSILLLLVGDLIASHTGFLIMLIFAIIMDINAYFYPDKIVLYLSGAHKMSDKQTAGIEPIIKSLADKAGLPIPRLYVIDSDVANALITGRDANKVSIAITTGLLKALNQDELTGICAYLLSQVKNRDIFANSASVTIASPITGLANLSIWSSIFSMKNEKGEPKINHTLMAIFAPIAGFFIRLMASSSAVFEADNAAAKLCGNPLWLAHALEKLEAGKAQVPFINMENQPAIAPVFVVNSLQDEKLAKLFLTHPTTLERVRLLQAMATKS